MALRPFIFDSIDFPVYNGRLNAALWYNMWPDNDMPERWENRFMWIGRYVCCQFRPYGAGDPVSNYPWPLSAVAAQP